MHMARIGPADWAHELRYQITSGIALVSFYMYSASDVRDQLSVDDQYTKGQAPPAEPPSPAAAVH